MQSNQIKQEPAKHSPVPWELRPEVGRYPFLIRSAEGVCVAAVYLDAPSVMDHDEMEANAAFIARAVNNHDALVQALKPFAELAEQNRALADYQGDSLTVTVRAADLVKAWQSYSAAQEQNNDHQ